MISSQNASSLGTPDQLKLKASVLGVVAALLGDPEIFQYRSNDKYRTFIYSDGSGNELNIFFTQNGAIIRGFDHESATASEAGKAYAGVLDDFPDEFKEIYEDEFDKEDLSFCIWCLNGSSEWKIGSVEFADDIADPDGSQYLLRFFGPSPSSWLELAKRLNPDADLSKVKSQLAGLTTKGFNA